MDSISTIDQYFADNYAEARQKFLQVCKDKKLDVQSYVNDVSDDSGVELATDVIRIGNKNTKKLIVLTSGVHGVELMCGSGCQVGMLQQDYFASLPADTAIVMIHAINPWGAAHLRRNNENNIDLCRNFVDFDASLPGNEGYQEIHEALCCPEYKGVKRDKANAFLNEFRATQGEGHFVGAIMAGQFQYDTGMSFGGAEPTWSRKLLMNILTEERRDAEKVCLIDYHSGLGPYAYGSVVCLHEGGALGRARDWFGPWLMAPMERVKESGEGFHPAIGHTTEGHLQALPEAEVTSVVLEYGTYDMGSNLITLMDDHWLAMHGNPDSEEGRKIKQHMLYAHYPDDPEWRCAVWTRSQQVIRQAMTGLRND